MAIIDAFPKKQKMGVNFFRKNMTDRGGSEGVCSSDTLFPSFSCIYFPPTVHITDAKKQKWNNYHTTECTLHPQTSQY